MEIREYRTEDCPQLARLFYDTVHSINTRDYTKEQVDAWADGRVDIDGWNTSFLEHYTLVAVDSGIVAGFGDIDAAGYLDRLYVHKDYQGMGVATMLCDRLESRFYGRPGYYPRFNHRKAIFYKQGIQRNKRAAG